MRTERIIEAVHGAVEEIMDFLGPVMVIGAAVYIAAQMVRVML